MSATAAAATHSSSHTSSSSSSGGAGHPNFVSGQCIGQVPSPSIYMATFGRPLVPLQKVSQDLDARIHRLAGVVRTMPDYGSGLRIDFTKKIVSYTNKSGEKVYLAMGAEEVAAGNPLKALSDELEAVSRDLHGVFTAVHPRSSKSVMNRDGKEASLNPRSSALRNWSRECVGSCRFETEHLWKKIEKECFDKDKEIVDLRRRKWELESKGAPGFSGTGSGRSPQEDIEFQGIDGKIAVKKKELAKIRSDLGLVWHTDLSIAGADRRYKAGQKIEEMERLRAERIEWVNLEIGKEEKKAPVNEERLSELRRFKKELEEMNMHSVKIAIAFGVLHGLDLPGVTLGQRDRCAKSIEEYMSERATGLAQGQWKVTRRWVPFMEDAITDDEVKLQAKESADLIYWQRAEYYRRVEMDRETNPGFDSRVLKRGGMEEFFVARSLAAPVPLSWSDSGIRIELRRRGFDL